MIPLPTSSVSSYDLFDHLIEGVMVLDTEGYVVYANPRARQIVKTREGYTQGKHVDELFPSLSIADHGRRHTSSTIQEYINAGQKIVSATATCVTGRGTSTSLTTSLFPMKRMNDDPQSWLFCFVDISESIKDKLDRTRFVRVIGHELKHPLSSLKAYLYMIRKRLTDTSEKTNAYLNQAEDQIMILTAMLNDLTDISKISLQQFDVDPERQLVRPVLMQVVADFQVTHPDRKIELSFTNNRLKASIDAIRFRQVMTNILVNADRYSEQTSPIEIAVAKSNDGVKITITDEGVGISGEDVSNVFNAYFRTKQGYQHKGLGLGLYIAKEIMHRHGGEISLSSRQGKGTAVTLWFPS